MERGQGTNVHLGAKTGLINVFRAKNPKMEEQLLMPQAPDSKPYRSRLPMGASKAVENQQDINLKEKSSPLPGRHPYEL